MDGSIIDSWKYWTLNDEGSLTIKRWTESSPWENYADSINVIIYDNFSLSAAAFKQYSQLTEVRLNGVDFVGAEAFSGCPNLTSVILEGNLYSIGDSAFSNCPKLTHIDLSVGVSVIGSAAFFNAGLTSVTIPDGVTEIPFNAFGNCCKLEEVIMPESVETIAGSAFGCCESLKRINLSDSLTSIGSYAFAMCSGLSEVTIPTGVTCVDTHAFSLCTGLKEVVFLGDAPSTWTDAFYNVKATCYGPDWSSSYTKQYGGTLTWIIAHGTCADNLTWQIDSNGVLTISGTDTMHSNYSWDSYDEVVDQVVVKEGVTSLRGDAFAGFSQLSKVTLPNSLTTIEGCAFLDCGSLTEIRIPVNVTDIAETAFLGCYNLKNIYYDNSEARWETLSAQVILPAGVTVHCTEQPPVVSLTLKTSSGKPYLTWTTVAGAEKYEIWRATGENGTYTKIYTTTGTVFTNTSTTAGTTYYYKVKAICGASTYGNSAFSSVKEVTVPAANTTT